MKNGENKDIELNPALRILGGGEVVEEPELLPQELQKLNEKVVRESEPFSTIKSSLKNSDGQQNFGLSIKVMASVTPSIYEEKVRALGATPHRKRSAKNRSSVVDMMPSRLSLMNARDLGSTQAGSIQNNHALT